MKPRTYFRLALFFPFILWGICALAVFLRPSREISTAWNAVLMPITYFVFGIIFWLIPYTLLVVGLWIWSRKKSTDALSRMALFAPILLFVLLLIEVMLVLLPTENIAELARDLPGQAALLGGFSLVFGYLCVGIALGVFKFLQAKHLIVEETLAPPPVD